MPNDLGAVMLLANSRRKHGSFAERIGAEVKAAIIATPEGRGDHRKIYRGDWDYDGPGPFHKCTIDVDAVALPNGEFGYRMGIYASYVGNKPELNLANTLGIKNGLSNITFERGWASKGKRWTLPWCDVGSALQAIGVTVTADEFWCGIQWPSDY